MLLLAAPALTIGAVSAAGVAALPAAVAVLKGFAGALVAIGLVLLAVFVPAAFVAGIPGVFFRQFAVAIATAAAVSVKFYTNKTLILAGTTYNFVYATL